MVRLLTRPPVILRSFVSKRINTSGGVEKTYRPIPTLDVAKPLQEPDCYRRERRAASVPALANRATASISTLESTGFDSLGESRN